MKKSLLGTIVICLVTLQSFGQILNQAAAWPNASWTLNGTYDAPSLLSDPTLTSNFSYNDDNAGNGSTDILVAESPFIDLTATFTGGETWINVDYDYDYNLGGTFDLEYYDADATSWVTWEAIPDNSGTTSNWCAAIAAPIVTSTTLDISAFTATQLSGFQYRFNYDASSTWGWGFCMSSPTIYSTAPPSCLITSTLNASNISATSADLDWATVTGAVDYNVEWGTPGFTPGTATELGSAPAVAGLMTTASGLSSLTTYEFYVQTNCGASTSGWAGPFSFITPCAALTSPWMDDVEAMTTSTNFTGENCWSATSVSGYDWNIDGVASTPSSNTGPLGANSGSNYFYTEASGSTIGDEAILIAPAVDLTGLTVPMLQFYYHMTGAQMGTLNVEISDDNGATWNLVTSIVGQQQTAQADPFLLSENVLVGYTGVIQIRFRAVSAGSFQGDISLDDFAIIEAPSCPSPTMLAVTGSDAASITLGWTPGINNTEWILEYGAPGFTPGTGVSMITSNNPETIGGLTPNSFYDVYLREICGPGDTSTYVGPANGNTYNQPLFMTTDNACPTAGFIDISGTATDLGLGDDNEVGMALPFDVLYQGVLMSDITIGANGGVILGTQTANVGYGGNFNTLADGTLFPWGDDLHTGTGGVYQEVQGTAPNQVFIVQWNAIRNFGGVNTDNVTFQLQIEEATGEIYFVYNDVEFGGSTAGDDFAANADIGISGPSIDITVSTNDTQYLTDNTCAHFFYTDCPSPVNFTVTYLTADEAGITWDAGLAGETNWTVIYGPTGFDPLATGTTITTVSTVAIIPGLNDITTYDVYIYADCVLGALQSNGAMGQFTTLPYCSDPTAFNANTAIDSLLTDWMWTESSGIGTYAVTGFDLQYGLAGFGVNDGTETIINANTTMSDTSVVSLLGGGVYEVYIQAVCGTDSSSWVGPVSFTMPITNDSTCNAIDLMVDGTVYTFNNTGATTQLNESTIAPPPTGYQTSNGWGNSNIDFTTWFTFTAPASGNVNLSGKDAGFDGQFAVYEVTDCSDLTTFTLVGANDDALDGSGLAPDFSICGLTSGNTYYLMHDSWSTSNTGTYSIRLDEISVEAGTTSGMIDVCTGGTANLFTGITGYDTGGVWSEEIPTASFADSVFPSAGLAYQVFNFEYRVTKGCAMDSVIQQVQIYGPSSAGTDGAVTACQNEPIDLLSGLGGNVDLGGTWYDPSNNPINSAIVASSIPGSFNYDYITSNGVCPEDTANVVLTVDPACDYLNLEELVFGDVEIFPNPTTGKVYITNNSATEVFNYTVTDLQGKVLATSKSVINGTETTEVNLDRFVEGIYMIQLYNDNAKKTYRIVKQ